MLPSITIIIPTYGRFGLLCEAMGTCLHQDYKGEFSILVINSCPQQTIKMDDPRIRVINLTTLFTSCDAQRKRNMGIQETTTSHIVFLDSDDMIMPWHLSRLVKGNTEKLAVFANSHDFFFREQHKELTIGKPHVWSFLLHTKKAKALGDMPMLELGEDWAYVNTLRKTKDIVIGTDDIPSYIYRWANADPHLSLMHKTHSTLDFAGHIARKIAANQEPSGDLIIRPIVPEWYINEAANRSPCTV